MKARGKNTVYALTLLMIVYLLLPTCMAYAAPAAPQKSAQPAQPAVGTASTILNPNAPPQGTITITTPQSGATWYTGMYYPIRWTCNGTRSNSVTISLWENGKTQTALIATGQTTGNYAYIVPLNNLFPTNYEVRVTNEGDTRVEARLPITIAATTITLAGSPGSLITGSSYTINWTYTGNLPYVNLAILDPSGKVQQSVSNIPIGSSGKGSWSWSVPAPGGGYNQYRFQISAMLPTSVTSNATTDTVFSTTGLFTILLPQIQVGSFIQQANVAECSPGKTYQITWGSQLNGRPVKVELYSTYGKSVVQTIQSSIPSQAQNSISWTVPSMNATLNKTPLNILVTSLDFPAVQGAGDIFTCEMPGIKLTSPDPQQGLMLNQTYQIGWQYWGDPGPHVRIDLLSASGPGRSLMAIATPTQSTAVQCPSPCKYGQGQFSWTFTTPAPLAPLYIQITGVENPSVQASSSQYAFLLPGAGGTAAGGGGTTGTSTVSSSGSSGTTSSGTTSKTSAPSTQTLTKDTSFKYNASNSATFAAGTTVTLDANGYALSGYLSKPLPTVTYGNLVVSGDQTLYYASGSSAAFQAGSYVTFGNGYLVTGYLSLSSDQTLYYRSGGSAIFWAGSFLTCRSGGYVKSGTTGGAKFTSTGGVVGVQTFPTANGVQTVPAQSYVTFDNNGYLASFVPPGVSVSPPSSP